LRATDRNVHRIKLVISRRRCYYRPLIGSDIWPILYAFVASRVDYCGSLLIGSPKKTTDKPQRVLSNVSCTRKCNGGLSQYGRSKLHCLDVDDQVRFRVRVQMLGCLHNMALCQPVSSTPAFLVVGTSTQQLIVVSICPRMGVERSLTPYNLELTFNLSLSTFKRHLKTFFFSSC